MSQKKRHISFENQHFLKIQPLVVEFLKNVEKNVDFHRRYNAVSETPVHIFLLHSVFHFFIFYKVLDSKPTKKAHIIVR